MADLRGDVFAVVGCSECEALWIVKGRPETTQCPRCRTRHSFGALRQFVTTEDRDEARDARSALLARRQGESEAFESLDSFADLDAAATDAGPSDDEYLRRHGIDPDVLAESVDRGSGGSRSASQRDVVLAAVDAIESADRDAIVQYGTARGMEEATVRSILERLVRAGELTVRDGVYRSL
ncbi:MAG: DUF5817 domain-containing protein [Halanaeroarchaeum sp.]